MVQARTDDRRFGPGESSGDDAVWRALGNPQRRRLLDLLRGGPRTTGELCEAFPHSRFAVMKHLRILEEAELVLVERRGRERYNHINPVPIRRISRRWIRPIESRAADMLSRIKTIAEA